MRKITRRITITHGLKDAPEIRTGHCTYAGLEDAPAFSENEAGRCRFAVAFELETGRVSVDFARSYFGTGLLTFPRLASVYNGSAYRHGRLRHGRRKWAPPLQTGRRKA